MRFLEGRLLRFPRPVHLFTTIALAAPAGLVLFAGQASDAETGKEGAPPLGRIVRLQDTLTPQGFDPPEVRADENGVRTVVRPMRNPARERDERIETTTVVEPPEHLEAAPGWKNLGLYGGSVASIEASPLDPNLVLAGLIFLSQGLYRSTDGGATWTRDATWPFIEVNDIEFTPAGIPYIGTSSGFYRGTAAGTNWQILAFRNVLKIVLNPSDPNEIWICTYAEQSTGKNLFRSLDGGTTWVDKTPPGGAFWDCTGVAFNPANRNIAIACFSGWIGGGPVFRTLDGGATWIQSIGTTNNPKRDIVHDGTRFLICGGQEFGNQTVGVYASSNDGQNWVPLSGFSWPSRAVNDLELDPQNPNVILAATTRGLVRSTDGGYNWTLAFGGTLDISVNTACILPSSSSTFYLGVEAYGVMKSTDDGEHVDVSSKGISSLQIFSVAGNPNDPNEIAAAFQALNSGGVFMTHDRGETWTLEHTPPTRWDALRYRQDGTLFAASQGPSTIAPEGVYRRHAGGSWTHYGPPNRGPLYETDVMTISVSEVDPNLMLAGGSDWISDRPMIWRTGDGGSFWLTTFIGTSKPPFLSTVFGIEIIPDGTDLHAVAATNGMESVILSPLSGALWPTIAGGIPSQFFGSDLAISPADPNDLYLADFYGFPPYKSTNGGASWVPTGTTQLFRQMVCDAENENVVYGARASDYKLMRSVDGAARFQPFDAGVVPPGVYEIVRHDASCPALLVAANDGAYRRELDTSPPSIEVRVDRPEIWPPNHKMAPIVVTVTVHDECDGHPTVSLVSITNSENGAVAGSGHTIEDVQGADFGTPDTEFELRCERSGGGDGRVYTIVYSATDAAGDTATASATVTVPHDQSGVALASTGFVEAGTGLVPGVDTFTLLVPASAALDASGLDPARVAIGNHLAAIRPLSSHLVEATGDGRMDLALEFDAALAAEVLAQDPETQLALRYVGPNGTAFLVGDIFALGASVPLPGSSGTGSNHVPTIEGSTLPAQTGLLSLRPNPFNPNTSVEFGLVRAQHVVLEVHDLRGARVNRLVAGVLPAGVHHATWNGRDTAGNQAASGVYFFRLVTEESTETWKAVLMK